jgi:hypothetical protein
MILLTLVLGLGTLALAEDKPAKDVPKADAKKKDAKVPTLKDLAWMAGAWAESEGPSVFTETWHAGQGDAMAGVAHWTISGRTRMFELMSIETTASGLVLNVRHFHKGLVPWPSEVKGPITWPLKSLDGKHAVFEHPTRAWPKRMEYHRKGDVLAGRLSGMENGRPKEIPFTFRLQR